MTNPATPRISVVVPAYNEAARLGPPLALAAAWLARQGSPSEILVVDDGSRDRTAAVAEELARTSPVPIRVLRNGQNRGKGYSVKHGVLEARGEFVLVSDADFSTPIEDLPRLLAPLEARVCDLAIGSRGLPDSRIEVRQAWWREAMGRTFNRILRVLTGLRFRDTQCGFKVLRREAVLPLFRAARIERFAWDVEILCLARRAGLRVCEMPVRWRNSADSRVHPVRDSVRMLRDTLRVVRWLRRGRYGAIGRSPVRGGGA